MTTEPAAIPKAPATRPRSEHRFPVYDLADSVTTAKAVHEKGGGVVSADHLAAYLNYKSANNGAYINRVASAKLFGLIEGPPNRITITPRAEKILMPVQAGDLKQALVEAFLAVPLYEAVYREYHSKELPPEFGLKNAFRTMFGVTPGRVDEAFRAFMGSAETAGFFEVRGSRTQLIMPAAPAGIPRTLPVETPTEDAAELRGGGDGGGGPTQRRTPDDLKGEYVSTLISILKAKGNQGEIDTDLMQRIEKLLGVSSQ